MDGVIDALIHDNVEMLKEEAPEGFFLLPPPSQLDEIFHHRPTLVAFAAYYGAYNCLMYMKGTGCSLTNCDELGLDAIHFAAANNKSYIVEMMCDLYDQKLNQDNELRTPLHIAVQFNSRETVKSLIERNADVNAKDIDGFTPLHYANDISIAQILIENDANINARSNDSATPLCLAAKRGNNLLVGYLISCGARLKIKTRNSWSIFHFAAMGGDVKTIRLIYKNFKEISTIDRNGRSPLHYSAEQGDALSTFYFIKHGCDTNLQDQQEMTPIHFAASEGNIAVAKILINHGADVRVTDNVGRNCIHFAALSNNSDVVQFFSKYLSVDSETLHGALPIHVAAAADSDMAVKELSDKNYIDRDSFYGKTPLAVATEHGSTSVIRMLVKLGASVSSHDRSGYTPIDKAIIGAREEAYEILSDAGATPSPLWSRKSSRASSQASSPISSPILRNRIYQQPIGVFSE